jgi:Zn-dependent M28 family amino/carboxypeptidase
MRFRTHLVAMLMLATPLLAQVPANNDSVARAIVRTALVQNRSIEFLRELCDIGPRLSGSEQYEKAVQWSKATMERLGADRVWLEPVKVPHWVRGNKEEAVVYPAKRRMLVPVRVAALGGSMATPEDGLMGEVVEVRSFDELKALGTAAKGKIIFFNRPMDRGQINTFAAYGGAVDQRGRGAIEAARAGGIAAVIRSMTTRIDDVPHTGAMGYHDSIPKIPVAAVSTRDADRLSELLRAEPGSKMRLTLNCETLPDAATWNVIGEIRGSELPNEVIVVGGHLDSWDKGDGAHDDGAGCVQSIEVLRLIKELGLKPKRTIRAVMFANEENGLRGGIAYAAVQRPGERHVAAIESDAGGFVPRGFGVSDSAAYVRIKPWEPLFAFMNADRIVRGGGGADISPLMRQGVPGIGLNVDSQRYFDVHHSDNDVFEAVNERELALGAGAMAVLAYLIAEEGL